MAYFDSAGNRKRNYRISVYFSEDELDLMDKKISESQFDSRSSYIRRMTLDGYIIKNDYTHLKELISEINSIGNNINQITKLSNSSKNVNPIQVKELNESLQEIWKLIEKYI